MHGTGARLTAIRAGRARQSRLPGLFIAMLLTACAWGEFRPYQSADFEDGRGPDSMDPFGVDIENTLKVVDLSQVPNMPPAFRDETASRVTGKFGVGIRSDPDPQNQNTRSRGFSIGVLLDRDKLGATGRALYQADFYLPPANAPELAPCIAVLALDPTVMGTAPAAAISSPKSGRPKAFYRFGIARRTAATLYFSCLVPGAESVPVYVQDRELYGAIPRPGWHRFAMLFTGPEEIRVYLDGKEPRFSPIKDSRLRKLKLGVMLADTMHKYECYVDNLTILWSMDNSAVPLSPFTPSWANVSVPSAAGTPAQGAIPSLPSAPASAPTVPVTEQVTPPPLPGSSGPMVWLAPTAAWAEAQQMRHNFLLFFFSPTDPASAGLAGMLDESPGARAFARSCSKTKVDVTQQQGLNIARGYRIQAVPTMVVFSPEGEEIGRATFTPRDTWETFASRLGVR